MIKYMYASYRFLFELFCLWIVGYWGVSRTEYGNFRFVLGVLAVCVLMIVWGIWGAPSSLRRLKGIHRLGLELGVALVCGVCLYHTNFAGGTVVFVAVALVNAGINFFTKWLI